jgi:DNA primase catalytic subunit
MLNRSINIVQGNNHCLFRDLYKCTMRSRRGIVEYLNGDHRELIGVCSEINTVWVERKMLDPPPHSSLANYM